MKNILLILMFLLVSCKSVKEKKICFAETHDKTVIDIKNFQEMKSYVEIDDKDLVDSVWIIDGEVITDSIENIINNKKFDFLDIEVIREKEITFGCKRVSAYILIKSNNCLNKYK